MIILNRTSTNGQYVKIDQGSPKATAYCDLTGFYVMHADLVPQKQWSGNTLVNTGYLVHKDFVDKPNPSFKTPIFKLDPKPLLNARPFGPQQLLDSQDDE